MTNITQRLSNKIFYTIAFIVTIFYITTILYYGTNLPLADDYTAVLNFLNKWQEADNLNTQITLLNELYNGAHRLIIDKLIYLAQYYLLGEVNFYVLTLFGMLCWLLIVWILWLAFIRLNYPKWYFIPVLLVMFSFTPYVLMTWAMASIQQNLQLLFALLAIFYMSRNTNQSFIAAFLFTICAIYTSAGGLALLPIIAIMLILQKRYKLLIVFSIVASVLAYIYFLDFPSKPKADIYTTIEFFLVVTGGISFRSNVGASILSILFFILIAYLIRKKYYVQNKFLFWSIIFCVMVTAMIALGRSVNGMQDATMTHYKLYPVALFSICYIALVDIIPLAYKRNMATIFCIIALVFYAIEIPDGIKNFEHYKQQDASGEISYRCEGDRCKQILCKSQLLSIYDANRYYRMDFCQ